ncbi:MAG: hypothetical protein HY260_03990, partial [Chloroflexi bacterium]|nr:hypothetical protein [Chloroflexota bacterium]
PLLINPSPPKALGLLTALLALAGLATLGRGRMRARDDTGRFVLFGGGLFAYSLMTLPVSRPLWDHLPLLPFVQFPWRMLMPAALCASILAGAVVYPVSHLMLRAPRFTPQAPRDWLAASLISAIALLGNLSWWNPRYCAPFVEETVARMLKYEYATATVGTSAKAECLPQAVKSLPDDDSIALALERGEEPDRLRGLPEGTSVDYLSRDPLALEFRVRSPQAFELTYEMFDYAGWAARVDGASVPISPTAEHALINFGVPAGTHAIAVRFGPTPLRVIADAISILTALTLTVLLILRRRAPIPNIQYPSNAAQPQTANPYPFLFALSLFALKVLWIDNTTNPFRHSDFDGATLTIGTPINQSLAGGLVLLSYEKQPAQIPSGGEFDTTLYLTTRVPGLAADYRPKFTLVGADGAGWNSPDAALPPRWHREPPSTQIWIPGQYAQWARREAVLPGAPPGRYRLVGRVFDLQSLIPDSIVDANGNALTPDIDLGEIVVTRPALPADPATLGMQYPSGANLGSGLTLLGYNLDRAEARPGDTMLVTLFWRADESPRLNVPARLSLQRDDGLAAFTTSFPPVADTFPTSEWEAGDVWRGQHFVRLPADLGDGTYQWRLALGGGGDVEIGSLRITAPARSFNAPPFDTKSGARFGDFAELAGFSLAPSPAKAGGTLTLTLVWRAVATPDASYSAFVHLSDASGRVWAQSDAIPVNWTRPTTGWLAGEYIVDPRSIVLPADLPPGSYTLKVGMADARTGARAVVTGPGSAPERLATVAAVAIQP